MAEVGLLATVIKRLAGDRFVVRCPGIAPAGVQGHSFAPLLDAPARLWKAAAFSQYPPRWQDTGPLRGYAIRTDRYRYVARRKWNTTGVVARELYDHQADPAEVRNAADHPAQAEVIRQRAARFRFRLTGKRSAELFHLRTRWEHGEDRNQDQDES